MATRLQNLKRLEIFVAMLVISLTINAQTWYIYGEYTWSAPHPVGTFHELHHQGEAVTIGGMEYTTIYVNSEVNGNYLDGAYRNDDNQVYYCRWNGSSYESEELLYDYDLEEGEYFLDETDHPMRVTEVTIITDLNGVSRKKISFNFLGLPSAHEVWIEGIGSDRGFMHVGQWEAAHDSEGEMYHMLCYHVNDDVIYVNPEYNDCDIDDVEENTVGNSISIYPNPANEVIKILNDNNLSITGIEIIDLTGRIVLSTEKCEDINISELAEGQYFVKIIGETTIVKKLFIKK